MGATGNFASPVVQSLKGHSDVKLRLTSRSQSSAAKLRSLYPNAEVIVADWNNRDSLVAAFEGAQRALMITPDLTDEATVVPNVIAAVNQSPTFDLLVRLIAIPPIAEQYMTDEWLSTKLGVAMHWLAKSAFKDSGLPMAYINVPAWTAFTVPWLCGEAVRTRRELPLTGDAIRPWIVESDASEVMTKVLLEGPDEHAGREYVLTGPQLLNFAGIAQMLSEEIGEKVSWVDSSEDYKAAIGEHADALAIYAGYSGRHAAKQPITDTLGQLLGRPATTMHQYVKENLRLFK
ncbi:NAD(P)H-binding protein [Mesorhizobium sp. M1380]|uniref:NmrA family NAD(P)-binding protein n=1 Tax=Mesorhizobium sp. M1380 TaxID=2957093 RepID=UPI0033356B3D